MTYTAVTTMPKYLRAIGEGFISRIYLIKTTEDTKNTEKNAIIRFQAIFLCVLRCAVVKNAFLSGTKLENKSAP